VRIIDLGLIDYDAALAFQRRVHDDVRSGAAASTLVLCRHTPVITLGRNTDPGCLKHSATELERRGIRVTAADRGGQATYHGPGQQVIYAICDLRSSGNDLHAFLRSLEGLALQLLAGLGIQGERAEGKTGVWIGSKKIASIGIGVRGWVTFHGAAVNVKIGDMDNFRCIRPCGMDIEMTSVEEVLGCDVAADVIADAVKRRLGDEKCGLA
jgi:lipoyl(octanoyl) transferase